MNAQNHVSSTEKLKSDISKTFDHPPSYHNNVHLKPTSNKDLDISGPPGTKVDLKTVSNMKVNLTSMINRVDLLTDAKIGEVKTILQSILDSIDKLNKRVERQECI